MSQARLSAGRRLASRLITIIMALRYIECTRHLKRYQSRLAFLRRMGVHPVERVA